MIDRIYTRFRNYPLTKKLTAVIMLASILVVLLSFFLFVATEAISYWRLEREKLTSMADIVGQNSIAAITFGDAKAAEETLSGLRNNPHILAAYIEYTDGSVFAEYLSTTNPGRRLTSVTGRGGGSLQAVKHRPFWAGISMFEVSRPIMLENQMIGRIVIQSDREELMNRLASFSFVSILILLSAFLFSFFISRRLQHLVSQPILDILQTMRAISREKKYSLRVAKQSEDELGALALGFNNMLDQIQVRDAELEKELVIRKRAEEQVRKLAYYDSLTGLPNRTFFKELMIKALAQVERHKQIMAVMFMDLDNFKRINDTLGHAVGDQLLQAIPDVVLRCIRKSDIFARHREDEILEAMSRLGGDEFIVLLNVINKSEDAAIIARRILAEMKNPFSLGDNEIYCSASIGIAVFPQDGKDADTLLKSADMAMYHAKAEGKNNFQFYTESMNIAVLEKTKTENDLRRALEKGEFVLYYHQKMDASRNKLIGVEALIRWQHPERGLVLPFDFIHIAEESGLIVQMGEWVLQTACLQWVAWQKAGFTPQHISVNISCRQFEDIGLLDAVRKVIQDTQIDPRYLEFEITESTIMKNPEMAITLLQNLISLGIQISVDDFGTGYSSLSYLRRLPLTTLKIDRSFIRELPVNKDDISIVKAITVLAHSLRLKVVAEGVETQEQHDFLKEIGCDGMQGFFWNKPLPSNDITTILTREKT
jgi:diguanylate cyclase (GGDEF)-like protein